MGSPRDICWRWIGSNEKVGGWRKSSRFSSYFSGLHGHRVQTGPNNSVNVAWDDNDAMQVLTKNRVRGFHRRKKSSSL